MSHRGLRVKIVLPCIPGGIGIVLKGREYGRDIPAWLKLRDFVLHRDQHRCKRCHRPMPPSELVAHHKKWVSRGGNDKPSNLITVCSTPAGGCHAFYHPWLRLQGWTDQKLPATNTKSSPPSQNP